MAEMLPYADSLRAIGRFLDGEAASRARIVEDPVCLAVTWLGRDKQKHERQYRKADDMPTLILQPKRERFHRRDWENSWEERLRTIGQELDADRLQLVELVEAVGFKVTSTTGDGPVRHWYTWDDLARRSEEHRRLRRGAQPTAAQETNGSSATQHKPRLSASIGVDPRNLADDSAAIAKSVIQPLLRLAGPAVGITIEIKAQLPPTVPEDAVEAIEESFERLGFSWERR